MITDQEMLNLINEKAATYAGLGGDLTSAVGILVLSRIYGWRVMRLIVSRRQWNLANKIFGDIKNITPDRGEHARKSVGLAIADKIGDYWAFMRGQKNQKEYADKNRKMIVDNAEGDALDSCIEFSVKEKTDQNNLEKTIEELKLFISNANLNEDQILDIKESIAILEIQAKSKKPKLAIIQESIDSLKKIENHANELSKIINPFLCH